MIEFITIDNVNAFSGNPLKAQHELRYRSIIERQKWDVPEYNHMEFDQYDNPAAKYLVYSDRNGTALGVSRFYPTILPYMLEQVFPHYVTWKTLPKSASIWEGSRFCIERNLPVEQRRTIINQLIVGYLEVGLQFNLEAIVGLMYPAYWRSLFISAGWPIEFMGDVLKLEDGNKARSAYLPISASILNEVRSVTQIHSSVVNFGKGFDHAQAA